MKVKRQADLVRERTKPKKRKKLKRGTTWPDLDSLLDPDNWDDPLADFDYTDDIEADAEDEANEIVAAIREQKRQQRDLWRLKADTEFFLVVCFQSRDQKEEFLEKAGWLDLLGDKYIDGLALAELLDVDVEPVPLKIPKPFRMPKGLRKHDLILEKKGGDS